MNDTQDLTVITNTNELIFNQGAMKSMMDLANFMASAKATIPAHLKGSPADCMAIIMQSAQFRMNPYSVAQKTFLVNGVLGYEAQLISAVITNNGPVTGRFYYEFFGDWTKVQGKTKEFESKTKTDDAGRPKKFRVPAWTFEDEKGLGVVVSNTIKGETEPRKLTLYLSQALTRNSTQWSDDAQQQLSYLAVKKWARRYCPDVILGVYSPDELEEVAEKGETVINPLPGDEEPKKKVDINAILESIKTMSVAEFITIDPDTLTPTERSQVSAAFKARKKAIMEASVVADIKPTPPPEKKPEEPKKASEAQDKVDWHQLLFDAKDDQAALMAIMDSIPDIEIQSVFDGFTDAEFLKRCYLALSPERQDQFSGEFDLCQGFLLGKG